MGGGEALEPTKYHSIHEIPDELVQTYSKRDPNNKIYETRRWVNFKKKQILYQQNDGVPNYLRGPFGRSIYYITWVGSISLLFYNFYKWNEFTNKKK